MNEVSARSEFIIAMEAAGNYESFLSSLAPSSAAKYRVRIDQLESYCKIQEMELIPSSVQLFLVDLHEKYMVSTLWSIFAIIITSWRHSSNGKERGKDALEGDMLSFIF